VKHLVVAVLFSIVLICGSTALAQNKNNPTGDVWTQNNPGVDAFGGYFILVLPNKITTDLAAQEQSLGGRATYQFTNLENQG
jgi:hypothetical protein